ncbi:MAG: methyltransferase domain-containing protein [Alphaproteobacteria bacterium]|nr:methyltransferase domain-containing protein [Alphaproteobacteria bacterium]
MPPSAVDTAAAQAYEDHLVGALFGPWAQRVVDLGAPQRGETVLDVACGTGIGARLAGPRVAPGGRVVSADSDAGMVTVAERMAAAAGLPADVTFEWHAAPAEAPVVAHGSVDLCLCMQGPQFVADPPAAMAMIRRALKPGGRLAASMWSVIADNKGHYALAQALEARGLAPAAKPFSLGDPETARALVADAGLDILSFETADHLAAFASVRAFVNGVAAGAPATRFALAQLSDADREAFVADVERLLAPHQQADGIALPTRAHLVLARR